MAAKPWERYSEDALKEQGKPWLRYTPAPAMPWEKYIQGGRDAGTSTTEGVHTGSIQHSSGSGSGPLPKVTSPDAFHTALMEVENSTRTGFNEGMWRPHASLEGGTPTVAYGHKLSREEVVQGGVAVDGEWYSFGDGLPDEAAEKLLYQDVSNAKQHLEKKVHGYEKLPQKYKDVLVNIQFNTGDFSEEEWPKLMKAIRTGDDEGVRREMVTSAEIGGERVQLGERAVAIADAVGLSGQS